MSSVLVGMFDSRTEADDARVRLVSAGFVPSAVTSSADVEGDVSTKEGGDGGGFMGWLHSIFGSDDSADRDAHGSTFKEAFRRGAFGLTVPTTSDEDTDKASEILDRAGAIDVDERSRTERWTSDSTVATVAPPASVQSAIDPGLQAGTAQKVAVVEESLAVGKRAVARGGVRVFSRIVEVPVEETVRLREEHASVQRRVVDRPATEADFAAFKEGSFEVRTTAEEAVVSKTARVVGEVEIGTQVTERDEVIRDTVRKTEVDVEQLPGGVVPATDVPKS